MNPTSHRRIKRGAYQQDRPSKIIIGLRRLRRIFPRLLLLMLAIAILCGGGWAIYMLSSSRDVARVTQYTRRYLPAKIIHISIEGANYTPHIAVLNALGIREGDSLFGFSVTQGRARLAALPFVEHATVERRMPDTVIVRIVERHPVAIWQNQGRFTLINRAGDRVSDTGLSPEETRAFLKLPLVVGAGANLSAAKLIDCLDRTPNVKAFFAAAVFVGQRRWDLHLKNHTVIYLPEGHEAAAIDRLARYQHLYRLLERPLFSIDLRLPDRMVIDPLTQPDMDPNDNTLKQATKIGARQP